jgi:hypothetical protein
VSTELTNTRVPISRFAKGRSRIEIPVGKELPTRELESISALRAREKEVLVSVACQ